MRLPSLFAICAIPIFGCSCINTAAPCSGVGKETAVFLGRVLVDSGEGWGKGPASVAIEEPFFNTPKDVLNVEIETSSGTSCYRRLQLGERYVIYARKNPQTGRLSIGGCSTTFAVRGKEHIVDAVRNLAKGGPSRLVGTVEKSTGLYSQEGGVEGAIVVAKLAGRRFDAIADAYGNYEFRAIPEGRYSLEVAKEGFVPDQKYNLRSSGFMVLDKATNVFEPDKTEPGSVVVGKSSCAVWDLAMWPNGKISGTIRNAQGQPVKGVVVEAFQFDSRGKLESTPLRAGSSDEQGYYLLDSLPESDYLVGVNADPYRDRYAYPPVIYSKDGAPVHLRVSPAAEASDIDLTVAPPRTPATLRVTAVGPDGKPLRNAQSRSRI